MYRKEKRFLIISIIIVVALIGFMYISKMDSSKNTNNKEINNIISRLPELIEIDYEENPIMYDFVNGSFGYRSNYDTTSFNESFMVAWNIDAKDKIFVSFYPLSEEIKIPLLGTNPVAYIIDENERKLIEFNINNIDIDRKYREGLWEFILIDTFSLDNNLCDSLDSNYKWSGIDFYHFNDMGNYGPMYHNIYTNGEGYPTSWLKKKEWHNILYERMGIDITDPFWDKYKLYERIIYENDKGKKIELIVNSTGFFGIDNGDDHGFITEQDLNILIEIDNYKRSVN